MLPKDDIKKGGKKNSNCKWGNVANTTITK